MSKAAGRKTALVNIGLLATPLGLQARVGKAQGELRLCRHAFVLMDKGIISQVGEGEPSGEMLDGREVVDAGGGLVTPGLVDAHTHLVFGGWRAHELKLKLSGVPYLDILAAGGGILSTVWETRAASEDELFQKAEKALDGMMALGTTTCEAKSGYGLNLKDELKQLRIVSALNKRHEMDLVSTLMAAHAVPGEYRNDRKGYIKLIISSIIPAAAKEKLAEYCDVFCEKGVFSVEESREILLAGQNAGLKSKIHADEIDATGGSELAGEVGAVSAEHLIAIRDSGIRALAEGGTIACLLPATSFYLGKPFARARDLITAGVPVAIGSDFNPGSSPGYSLQFCMNLARHSYRLTPEEILCAVTLNAAAAIGMAGLIGSIESGKQADMLVWDADDLEYLCYRFGSNLVKTVIKRGRRVLG